MNDDWYFFLFLMLVVAVFLFMLGVSMGIAGG
jgi:hypothetical protein